MRHLVIEADGGSRGNPGPAAYGAVVLDGRTGEILVELADYLGIADEQRRRVRGRDRRPGRRHGDRPDGAGRGPPGLQARRRAAVRADGRSRTRSCASSPCAPRRWRRRTASGSRGCRARRTSAPMPWPTSPWTPPRQDVRRGSSAGAAGPVTRTSTSTSPITWAPRRRRRPTPRQRPGLVRRPARGSAGLPPPRRGRPRSGLPCAGSPSAPTRVAHSSRRLRPRRRPRPSARPGLPAQRRRRSSDGRARTSARRRRC